MEEHRLKPMPANYDVKLFNELHKNTEGLRISLAKKIDCRRFGLEFEDILSWFDIKFIYAFTKYYEKYPPNILKGHIIKSLQMFAFRIMREAYLGKNAIYSNSIVIEEIEYFENLVSSSDEETPHEYIKLQPVLDYLKTKLSDNAFLILDIQLSLPNFILEKLEGPNKKQFNSIPNELLANYLGLPDDKKCLSYIAGLKSEIRGAIDSAREYFSSSPMISV